MEVGRRIRERRTEAGMSQDALAGRVYVSRQTISSWENDKTYPDVQSLLLLSEVFGVTIDTLVKGDVSTMEKEIGRSGKLLVRLGWAMLGLLALTTAALVWFEVQLVAWGWTLAQASPTIALALVLWALTMAAAAWADRVKHDNDLVTYGEVKAFMEGRQVDRMTESGTRARSLSRRERIVRKALLLLLCGAAGAVAGYLSSMGVSALAG